MKKISKVAIFAVCMMAVLGSSFSTYATNVSKSEQKKERSNVERNQDLDMVIGKITSIDANNVTIEVATRKKREKKSEDTANNQTDRTKPENDDKYTLTGESKTYNIASANLGKKAVEKSESSTEKNKGEALTYADYKVGDYVRISVNKETPTIAKRMRQANEGANYNKVKGNYQGGYKGSYTGKTKAEKAAE